jgi:hypothetical protein
VTRRADEALFRLAAWANTRSSQLPVSCVQGAEVAVFAATSPTLSAAGPVPLFLHDCKPMEPSVRSGEAGTGWVAQDTGWPWPHDVCLNPRGLT